MEELAESQQKELEKRKGFNDLEVRIALTNTYRHLFYPAQDPVKAPQGLLHYVLPAQDRGVVERNNNQQNVILKALKDCEKIRQTETAKPFAPIYILQKVWSAGLDSLSTKSLRDTFASKLELNILLEGEISLLRDTIRQGLQNGDWDLKIGDKLFIKTDVPLALPPNIEFSDEMVLYHRGILQLPAPKEIELSAQLIGNNITRIKWKAKGALKVTLYQNNVLVEREARHQGGREFRPSDEYETSIDSITIFKAIADYGNGENITKETRLVPPSLVNADKTDYRVEQIKIDRLSPLIELDGSINTVFTEFSDICSDRQVKGIESLELSVDRVLDYRKLGVTLPQLSKLPLQIDQTVLIRTGEQFVKLEYQGKVRGFQSLFSTINNLLNAPDTEADVYLKMSLDISTAIESHGAEIQSIQQALDRNQIERLRLKAIVSNKNS